MTHGVYRVTGDRRYRGHQPGTTFEAYLDRGAEERAIERGDIVLLERIVQELQPGSYTLPDGWEHTGHTNHQRPAQGRSCERG